MRRGGILSGFHPMPCRGVAQAKLSAGYIEGGLILTRTGLGGLRASRPIGDVRGGYGRTGAAGCGEIRMDSLAGNGISAQVQTRAGKA